MSYPKAFKTVFAGASVVAASVLLLFSFGNTALADRPAATVAEMKGGAPGKVPQQWELSAFQKMRGAH